MARVSRLEKELSAQRTGLVMFDALNGYLHPGFGHHLTGNSHLTGHNQGLGPGPTFDQPLFS